jgi:hypothetical protein
MDALERMNRRNERAYRRWKRCGLGLLGCALVAAVCGAQAEKPSAIEATEFVLRDARGLIRASLSIRPDGTPGLAMFDKTGKPRLEIHLSPEDDGGIDLHDSKGILRAAVAVRPDGTPGVGLFGTKGQVRASLDVGRDGSAGVNIYDDASTLRAALALRPDGTPAAGLFDERGHEVRSIECSEEPEVANAPKK